VGGAVTPYTHSSTHTHTNSCFLKAEPQREAGHNTQGPENGLKLTRIIGEGIGLSGVGAG
jgi:hypothetical protein